MTVTVDFLRRADLLRPLRLDLLCLRRLFLIMQQHSILRLILHKKFSALEPDYKVV